MSTYIAAQGCVGLGRLDLGQVLGQRVLMLVPFIVSCVVELKQTERGVRVERSRRDRGWLSLYLADQLSIFLCQNNLRGVCHRAVLHLVNMLPVILLQ